MIKNIFLCSIILLALNACSRDREDLKSPCAGNEKSPCGPRKAVNNWWVS